MGGILILSARVGAGHIRAAQAIQRAFAESATHESVHHVETLDYTNPVFRRLYSQAYVDIINTMPALYGFYYDEREKWAKYDLLRPAFTRLNTRPFMKLIEQHQPDITVCTHPMPAEIVSWLIAEGRIKTQQVVVVTDFDIHVQWVCPNPVHYFVGIDEARAHLEVLGVPARNITVSGIPIDPVFNHPKPASAMRSKHGLAPHAAVILVSAGGFGIGRIEEIIAALLRLQRPTQVVAVCGQNEELRERVTHLASSIAAGSAVMIKVVGYTTEMDEYMAAADLVVGKPGGLTMSESLASGQVFVVVNPIPGQEERNADHLLEEGAAIRCNNLPVLAYKIESLLDNAKRLALMRENVRRLARPRAAFDIVVKLQEMKASGNDFRTH